MATLWSGRPNHLTNLSPRPKVFLNWDPARTPPQLLRHKSSRQSISVETSFIFIDKKMFPTKKIILHISRFLNRKNLLGTKKIRIHTKNTKSLLIFQLKQFFMIKHNQYSFHLIPLFHFEPLLPKIVYYFRTFRYRLNGELVSDLSQYKPILVSRSSYEISI